MFKAGSIQGGSAVILVQYWADEERRREVPLGAAFWVKDGVIYSVNQKSRELAPQLNAAPETMKEDEILRVAH